MVKALTVVVMLILSGMSWANDVPNFVKKEGQLNPDMTNPGAVEHPHWFKNSFLDFGVDVKEAAHSNKRVILFFYQDGCPYCKKLIEVNLTQKNIAEKLHDKFDVISVNMWGDRELTDVDGQSMIEKKFAEKMRVMYTPTLIFFDENGGVVLRINGYYDPSKFAAALDYVSDKREKDMSLREYLAKLNPPPPAGKLHEEPFFLPLPFNLARVTQPGAKPLAVLFEQQQCPACDELHADILKRKETLQQIARLDVAQLDMWGQTPVIGPDGRSRTAAAWAKELEIRYTPSIVFFDASGKEVMRIEAYLKSFHIQSVMDYVASGAYKTEPSFQRFIEGRAEKLRQQGVKINIME